MMNEADKDDITSEGKSSQSVSSSNTLQKPKSNNPFVKDFEGEPLYNDRD